MDIIYQAMRDRRVFQPFGGIKKVTEEVEDLDGVIEVEEKQIEIWTWKQEVSDWISAQGECLTGCEICKKYEDSG